MARPDWFVCECVYVSVRMSECVCVCVCVCVCAYLCPLYISTYGPNIAGRTKVCVYVCLFLSLSVSSALIIPSH